MARKSHSQPRDIFGRFISRESSKQQPYTIVDSLGRKQRYYLGHRITEVNFTRLRIGIKEFGGAPETPVGGLKADPGKSIRGHYRYDGPGWIVADGDNLISIQRIPSAEIVPATTHGAAEGSHIKEFPAFHSADIEDIADAAFQISADPGLHVDPKQIIITSIVWNPETEEYDVEYMIDFSTSYGKAEG